MRHVEANIGRESHVVMAMKPYSRDSTETRLRKYHP